MRNLTYADQSLLVGDEAADTLLHYAAVLADADRADTVVMKALDDRGDVVTASFVLGAGVNLMAQSTSSPLDEPDNSRALEYMNQKLSAIASPPAAQPLDDGWASQPDV
jgi:hypothetical protein